MVAGEETGRALEGGHIEHVVADAFRALPGTLYVVATPLGNLRDLTLRALDVLATASVIAAEDTRVTATLLRRYGIATKAIAVHAHNEAGRSAALLAMLAEGKSVALVSDAGTPAISDPGARLVRAAHEAGHPVVPLPGPVGIGHGGVGSGPGRGIVRVPRIPAQQAKARRERLASFAPLPAALVIYEAPHRVRATVADLAAALSADRTLVVCRELTKTFETIARVTLGEAFVWFGEDTNRERGEFVLIVDVPPPSPRDRTKVCQPTPNGGWLRFSRSCRRPAQPVSWRQRPGIKRDAIYARAVALKPER
jgi:16S rRNA (cytidine1402-2'-O)-methyltransferase